MANGLYGTSKNFVLQHTPVDNGSAWMIDWTNRDSDPLLDGFLLCRPLLQNALSRSLFLVSGSPSATTRKMFSFHHVRIPRTFDLNSSVSLNCQFQFGTFKSLPRLDFLKNSLWTTPLL